MIRSPLPHFAARSCRRSRCLAISVMLLGVLLFELCTGQQLFQLPQMHGCIPSRPTGLDSTLTVQIGGQRLHAARRQVAKAR